MPPTSDAFEVRDIPGAGRGVIARTSLPNRTHILSTSTLAAYVVFREYRKEVCAQCFHYDRGRTLAVRDLETGKVFCSEGCRDLWAEEQGEEGVEAWKALETWVKARSGAVWCTATSRTDGERPSVEEIEVAWKRVEYARFTRVQETKAEAKQRRKALQSSTSGPVDPDILSFLLSGIIFVSKHPALFASDVLALAMDPTPYRTPSDLQSHANSFLQLVSLLPPPLSESCTTSRIQTLIAAASHNSFGIRAGSEEDMEEYMGYALYPDASYFNHSCEPNVAKKRKGRTWEFWTSGAVKEGEELCISYLGGDEKGLDVTGRRERLKGTWGFECGCGRVMSDERTVEKGRSERGDMPRLRTAKIDFSVKLTRSLMTRLARSPKSRPTKRIQITGTAAYLTTITWSKEYPGAYGFWTIDDQGWVYINELPTQDAQSNGSIGSFDDFSAVWSDPEDRKIIQAALNAEAECIMTQAKRLNKGLRPNL